MSDRLALESHPAWKQFQAIPSHLTIFMNPDLDPRKTTCPKLREILRHFSIAFKSGALKADLVKAYNDELTPILRLFLSPGKATDEIEIDTPRQLVKLDLAAKSTTKKKLRAELEQHAPTTHTTTDMDRPELIRLYKKHVLLEKPTEGSSSIITDPRFTTVPEVWTHQELLGKRRDDIRFALQVHRPNIFIPTKFVTVNTCARIYEKFILTMHVEEDFITEGVHYFVRP